MADTSEQTRITELVARLTNDYSTLTPDTVAEVVGDMHAAFDGSRVREFVPLLVERRARTALAELSV